MLLSILQSSDRLEAATINLQQSSESQLKSSESQLKVAESHVRVAESQARAVDDLLTSSHRLEQFTIYLMIINVVNIFILEYTTRLFNGSYGLVSFFGLLFGIAAMMAIAYRWPYLIRRRPRGNA